MATRWVLVLDLDDERLVKAICKPDFAADEDPREIDAKGAALFIRALQQVKDD